MRFFYHYKFTAIVLVLLGLLSSACGAALPTALSTSTSSPSLTATPTRVPTITSTPTPLPPLVVLLAPPGADEALVRRLQAELDPLLTQAEMHFQVRQQLSPADFSPSLRLVIALPPDPGVAALASAAPQTQFLSLGIPGIDPAPNLTLLGASSDRPDRHGFIAGVIAAMLAPDWRVGVISLADTVEGRAARSGFLNGVEYFCGLCRPAHPPFYEYPLYIELPSTASSAEWREAANYLVDHDARVVYVYPGVTDEAVFAALGEAGVSVIGGHAPPQSAVSSWVLSLTTDPLALALDQVWGLLDGSLAGGQSLDVPIQFTHINPDLFSPGKQRLASQILFDLLSDHIDTSVDLATGEFRP